MKTSAKAHAKSFGLLMLVLSPCAMAQVIPVSDVESLYSEVNNPANAGATLVLAPGAYHLSAVDPGNVARPKGGRIELQPDMSLKGVEGDQAAVIISAYDLPASSFPANGVIAGPNAAIRMGLGHNSLEWLTVLDARFAQANIDSGLQVLDPAPAYVRLHHVSSSGSVRGVNVLNFGPLASNQVIEVDITDSDFFDNDLNLSEGIRIGNFQGAVGSAIIARLSGNRSWGQKQGCLIVNNRARSSTLSVESSGNRFYGNGGGLLIIGGLSSNNTRADANTIEFEGHGDRYSDNIAASEFDHGGLIVLGTEDISASGGGSNNTVKVALWGSRMLGNDNADLLAVGARSLTTQAAVLNQNNRVTIEVRGDGSKGKWQPVEKVDNYLPVGPNYGNSAVVIHH